MLASIFGSEVATGAETADATAKTTGKVATGAKTASGDGKTNDKADGDGATADATTAIATADGSQLTVVPAIVLPAAQVQAATPAASAAGDATAQAPANGTGGKPAGPVTPDALAGVAAAPADSVATKDQAGAKADAATNAAADATATTAIAGKTDPTLTLKVDAAGPQAPQTPPPTAPLTPAATAVTPPPALAAATADTQAATPPPAKDGGAKDRVQAVKTSSRVDVTKTDVAPGGAAALSAKAADALQPIEDGAPLKEPVIEEGAAGPAPEAKSDEGAGAQAPAELAAAATNTPAALIHAAAVAVRGAPQTVANLAAQIVKKLDGRTSQFDVQLDPAGLGKVDVRIAIGADGRMSAAMRFDTPQAAAELRSRAAELHQAMEQAGFDLSGGMSFDVATDSGQGGQAQNQQADSGAVFRGRAFQAALDTTADTPPTPPPTWRSNTPSGVDIRI
jgi:Meckel syndrome type 1 protein